MNAAHFHLLFNHVPILGPPLAAVLLAYAIKRREPLYSRLALILLVSVALVAIPVYLSGEPAEEVLEHSRPISEPLVEAHEEAAFVSFVALELLGLAAGTMLWRSRRTNASSTGATAAALAGTVIVTVAMAWTAYLGGQIAHPEATGATPTHAAREADERR